MGSGWEEDKGMGDIVERDRRGCEDQNREYELDSRGDVIGDEED